jgi:dipeptidyl aminopeptidase/acylaminoacyl peptidase
MIGFLKHRSLMLMSSPTAEPRLVTKDLTIRDWKWTFNGNLVLVSESVKGSGLMIYALDPLTDSMTHLSPYVLRGAQLVKLSRKHPNKALFSLHFSDVSLDGIYLINLDKRKWEKVSGNAGFNQWLFDDDLAIRAAAKGDKLYHSRIYFKNPQQEWTEIRQPLNEKGRPISNLLSVSADGTTIYYVNNYGQKTAVLLERNLLTGQETVISKHKQMDLLWAGATLGIDGKPQAVVGYLGDLVRIYLDDSIKADFDMLQKVAPFGHISYVGASADHAYWLIRVMDGGPNRYYHYNRATQQVQFLFADRDALLPYDLATRHTYLVNSSDRLTLPNHLYLPAGSDLDSNGIPDKPLPTILYVHGGPWIGFLANSWFANRNFQLLANRGYAVINCEFRGATGYGKRFIDKGNREWGGKMHKDLVKIAQQAIRDSIADPAKVGIWGWSYGGYATATALSSAPDLFRCGVAMYGVYDLPSFIRSHANNPWWVGRTGNPSTEKGLAMLESHSPANATQSIQSPLFITHGLRDKVTPVSQSDSLVARLIRQNKQVVYVVYNDEGHDYKQDKSWISFWAGAELFLSQHLGGRHEALGDAYREPNFTFRTGTALLFPEKE